MMRQKLLHDDPVTMRMYRLYLKGRKTTSESHRGSERRAEKLCGKAEQYKEKLAKASTAPVCGSLETGVEAEFEN